MIENKNRNVEEAKSIEVAEESRETDWKSKSYIASMFMGEFDVSMTYPYPEQEASDKAIGDEICARIDAWAKENINGEEIDAQEVIPGHVFRGLAELGLFGIKIPKKYGGLGLSQTNYMRILSLLSTYCGSVAATLSAHQSIGVPQPLKLFGSEEQKQKYLPMIAKGAITAFALTEPTVGSDPANMFTTAEKSEDGKHWILNGQKLWCTNGAIADLLVVMARTPSIMKNGKERKQISAFVVETKWAGVEVLHRCKFMGIRAIENALIRFDNVKIPAENIIWGEGKGLRLALTTLNDGRLGIPAVMAGAVEESNAFIANWAKDRVQWGKQIGKHEAVSEKLAYITSAGYAMKAFADYGAAITDHGNVDTRMEAAAAKMFNSELGYEAADLALQIRGGRGFETSTSLQARGEAEFPFERMLRDSRINRIVEGTTDVMHLFLAREALDKHLSLAGGLFKKSSIGAKIGVLMQAAMFYVFWYPKLWVSGLFKFYGGFDGRIGKHLRWVNKRSTRLARALFHRMILMGPKLEMRQLTLNRLVDIGVELAVMGLVASRAQTELDRGESKNLEAALYWLDLGHHRVDRLFAELNNNMDAQTRKFATSIVDKAEGLPKVETPNLSPRPMEFGSDLTSGRQEERLELGGQAPESLAKSA